MSLPTATVRNRWHELGLKSGRRIRTLKTLLLSVASFSIATSCSVEQSEEKATVFEAWDVINEPSRFGRNYELRFQELPKSGSLNRMPWSDSY